eukprot:2656687-Ditylum_brightwellii.AAC.1
MDVYNHPTRTSAESYAEMSKQQVMPTLYLQQTYTSKCTQSPTRQPNKTAMVDSSFKGYNNEMEPLEETPQSTIINLKHVTPMLNDECSTSQEKQEVKVKKLDENF